MACICDALVIEAYRRPRGDKTWWREDDVSVVLCTRVLGARNVTSGRARGYCSVRDQMKMGRV